MRFKLISELQRCFLADSVTFRQRHAGCLVRVCKMMRSAKAGDKNVTSIKRQTGNAPQHYKRNTKTKWSTNQDEPGRVAETTRSKLMDTKEPKRGWRVVRSVSLAWGDGRCMENTLKPNITMSYDFWWRNASRRWKNTLQRADSWLLSLSSRCSLHGFVTGKALVRSVIAVSPAAIVRTCPASSPFISPVSRLGEKNYVFNLLSEVWSSTDFSTSCTTVRPKLLEGHQEQDIHRERDRCGNKTGKLMQTTGPTETMETCTSRCQSTVHLFTRS